MGGWEGVNGGREIDPSGMVTASRTPTEMFQRPIDARMLFVLKRCGYDYCCEQGTRRTDTEVPARLKVVDHRAHACTIQTLLLNSTI